MSLTKIKLPPGVYKNGTAYEAQGRWQDSNMMRWIDGTMRPIGGWIYANGEFLDGPGRGIATWKSNAGNADAGSAGTGNAVAGKSAAAEAARTSPGTPH